MDNSIEISKAAFMLLIKDKSYGQSVAEYIQLRISNHAVLCPGHQRMIVI